MRVYYGLKSSLKLLGNKKIMVELKLELQNYLIFLNSKKNRVCTTKNCVYEYPKYPGRYPKYCPLCKALNTHNSFDTSILNKKIRENKDMSKVKELLDILESISKLQDRKCSHCQAEISGSLKVCPSCGKYSHPLLEK